MEGERERERCCGQVFPANNLFAYISLPQTSSPPPTPTNGRNQEQAPAMFPALQAQAARTAKYMSTPQTKELEDYGLLIYDRYTNIFEPIPPARLPSDCVSLGPAEVLFLIEAPLNAVEVYEAMFRPRQPFRVHSARLIPRKMRTDEKHKQLVDEYQKGQGKLAGSDGGDLDREVSFIKLPRDAIWQLQMFHSFMWPVQLQYMSIPVEVSGARTVRSPYAIVCYSSHRAYHKKLKSLLKKLQLAHCKFERSLLRPGTVPVSETLKDYVEGKPGQDAATEFYAQHTETPNAPPHKPSALRRVTSTIQLRKAASRVSLRRIKSSASINT